MSLSEWVAWLQPYNAAALTSFLALVLFLGLYGATRRQMAREAQSRLDRLTASLELYSAAVGTLIRGDREEKFSAYEEQLLLNKLLACKAAPYLTEALLGQIGAYAADRDYTRLPLLLKTLERESEQLIKERARLLQRCEQPGWGTLMWQQFRPILPFLFTAAMFFCFLWLFELINESLTVSGGLLLMEKWLQLMSILFSLLLLYPALLGGRRKSPDSALMRIWGTVISLFALLHLSGPAVAPYILGVQLLLFFAGFRFGRNSKLRKSRPFVGHYLLPGDKSSKNAGIEPPPEEDGLKIT